jgi:hypothetical protein
MDIEFNKREDQNKLKLSEINQVLNQVKKVVVDVYRNFVMKER